MLSPLYGQLSPLRLPTKSAFDTTAALAVADTYIAAVEAADGQALESGVVNAIENFIIGLHQDGIWDAIKASCILAGARTLNGALVPLVGSAPTNFNFVSGDYNRETGLKGNASTKYLNTNRAENDDPQNNIHISTNITFHAGGINRCILGSAVTVSPTKVTEIIDNYGFRVRGSGLRSVAANATPTFLAAKRNSSAQFESRLFSTNYTNSATSVTPSSFNYYVYGRNNSGSLSIPSAHRISFYSIGESIDLALLESRVSTLMTDLATAIP
jgi:hypothetical protein